MAILFDDASTEYLTATTALLANEPITMSCWFNTDVSTIGEVAVSLGDSSGANGNWCLRVSGDVGGDPVSANKTSDAGTNDQANTSTGFSVNTWHHAAAVFTSDTSRAAFIDGGSKGTNATNVVDPTPNFVSIGALQRSTIAVPFSGNIAEVAIYNIALSDAEVALLALGASPLLVRPEGLVFYLPMIALGGGGTQRDWIGGLTMTETNTPATVAHPPNIFYPPQFAVGFGIPSIASALGGTLHLTGLMSATPLAANYGIYASDVPKRTFVSR